jgi:hypothetical protein
MEAQEAALLLELSNVQAEVEVAVDEYSAVAQDVGRLVCSSVVAGDCELKMVRQEYYRAMAALGKCRECCHVVATPLDVRQTWSPRFNGKA